MLIHPKPPFDFELTRRYQFAFESANGPDLHWDGSEYRRVLEISGKAVLVSVQSTGTVSDPELLVSVEDFEEQRALQNEEEEEISRLVGWLFGVGQDMAPFYTLVQEDSSDTVMNTLVRSFYGLHIPQAATVFECVVLTVLGQNLDFSLAEPMRWTLLDWYGREVKLGGCRWKVFPCPQDIWQANTPELRERLSFDELRERVPEVVGRRQGLLPEAKANGIRAVAGQMLYGDSVEDCRRLTPGQTRGRIGNIGGCGPWTAEWTLMRGLGYLNAFPHLDPALVGKMLKEYFSESNFEPVVDLDGYVNSIADRWHPYRSLGATYLLATFRGAGGHYL